MGMSRSESRRLALAQAKKQDEELQDWRKEQIGRRGQLVVEERARGLAPGPAVMGVLGRRRRRCLLRRAVRAEESEGAMVLVGRVLRLGGSRR